MAEVYITGIAGFLGSSLARRCRELGWGVHGIDLVPRSDARRLEGLELKSYTWGSMIDRPNLPPVDYVVHCAAVADVPFAMTSPSYTLQQNVMGTLQFMEAVLEAQNRYHTIQRIVVQSSESVYGNAFPGLIREDATLNPVNIYGASKAAQELVARSYFHAHQLPVTIIRSSTLYGPDMRRNQVVTIFLRQALRNQPITVHGDGRQSRDFNYCMNAVDGILLALQSDDATGDVFNIAGDNEISVKDLAALCVKVTGSSSPIVHTAQRPGEQDLHLTPDISHARKVLGYVPRVNFEEGLRQTAQHFAPVFRGVSISPGAVGVGQDPPH